MISIRHLRVLGFLAAFTLLFSGCVYKRLIYNNLDWLALYQLDSYFDLTSTQKTQIKIPVEETVAWLKAERLPAIINLIRDIHQAVQLKKIEASDYDRWMLQVGAWRQEITDRVAPPLAHLFKQLNADQIEHLQEKLEKADRELIKLLARSESEFPEEFADYVDEATSNMKFWFGKLRKPQKQLLVEHLGWNRSQLSEQLKQRRRSREFWLNLYQKQDISAIAANIKASSEPDGAWNDAEYRRFRQDSRENWRKAFIALFASLDEEQWKHLEKVLNELIVDLENLSLAQNTKVKKASE